MMNNRSKNKKKDKTMRDRGIWVSTSVTMKWWLRNVKIGKE